MQNTAVCILTGHYYYFMYVWWQHAECLSIVLGRVHPCQNLQRDFLLLENFSSHALSIALL